MLMCSSLAVRARGDEGDAVGVAEVTDLTQPAGVHVHVAVDQQPGAALAKATHQHRQLT